MRNSDPDRAGLTRLYKANQQQMSRLAAGILGPGPRAEDAVHDAFLKLIRHWGELQDRPEDRLKHWLAVVVKNTALDILRRERRESALEDRPLEPAAPADPGGFYTLVELIRSMPEDYRRVLELRFVAEWSLAEIAQELKLTEGAVKTRIFRGRRMLIRQLEKEGYLDGRTCV